MELGIESRCIHLENDYGKERFGAISVPIYQTATFAHPGLGQSTGYDYTRMQNPTREYLEKTVAALEKGTDCIAFASGMAAITTVMELFEPGDHLIVDKDLYGGTIRLFDHISRKNGIEVTSVNCCEDPVEAYIRPETTAVFCFGIALDIMYQIWNIAFGIISSKKMAKYSKAVNNEQEART